MGITCPAAPLNDRRQEGTDAPLRREEVDSGNPGQFGWYREQPRPKGMGCFCYGNPLARHRDLQTLAGDAAGISPVLFCCKLEEATCIRRSQPI